MTAAHLVDAVLVQPALVFGSLPPHGRDLDLLVRDGEERLLTEALRAEGYIRARRAWVRPATLHDEADAVELVAAHEWGLPDHALDDLFAQALPIEGLTRLVRPAPHHAVLILARRVSRGDGVLDERRRSRLESALEQEPRVWELARDIAPAWGATRALEQLRLLALTGRVARRRDRIAAVAERHLDAGDQQGVAALRAAFAVLRRPARGALVAVSGPDRGQAAQHARALTATFVAAGQPSSAVCTGESGSSVTLTPFQLGVALAQVLRQRREVRAQAALGVVTVSNTSAIDVVVRLREEAGGGRRLVWQRRLVRMVACRPLVTVVLDGPAGGRERLYRKEVAHAEAVLVSSDAPSDLIAREIAARTLPEVVAPRGSVGPWARSRAKLLYHVLAARRRNGLR